MFNFDPGYGACKERTRRSLVAATAVSALCANFVMGLLSNMPIAVAPGMGMNAYCT